jgi:hypothetical protein
MLTRNYIELKEINLIKSDVLVDLRSLFIDILISENIQNFYPTATINLNNDTNQLYLAKLQTDDIIQVKLKDSYSNDAQLILRIKSIKITSNIKTGDIRSTENNQITLECIPFQFNMLNKVNIIDSFSDDSAASMMASALTMLDLNPNNLLDIEESVNKLNYTSAKPIMYMIQYILKNGISVTKTPYMLITKHNININDKIISLKSIQKYYTDGLLNLRNLYFLSDEIDLNNERVANINNSVIIYSRKESSHQTENLYINKLKNIESQKLDLYRGKVDIIEDMDIIKYSKILQDNFGKNPDLENNKKISFVRSADMNYDNSVKSYFEYDFLTKLLNLEKYILTISENLNIHIGDICRFAELQIKEQQPIFSNDMIISELVHVITNESSETNIKISPLDPYFINPTGKIEDLIRKLPRNLPGGII